MLSASFTIFNATKSLPSQSGMPSWAKNTNTWPQKLVLAMACVSLLACICVFLAYCRGGHRRAEKVSTYYTMFAIGWFILSMILWAVTAALFQHSRTSNNNKDMWGWSCLDNKRSDVYSDKVDYALVCRLQVSLRLRLRLPLPFLPAPMKTGVANRSRPDFRTGLSFASSSRLSLRSSASPSTASSFTDTTPSADSTSP